ncbi:MAG: hypothetical protein WAU07_04875 [Microgenomates group bacterium]
MKLLNKHTILLLSVIVIGTAVRLYLFLNSQLDYYWDEVSMLVDVKSILETGSDMHGNAWTQTLFPSYGDFKLPLLIWVSALISKVFGFAFTNIRIPNLLAGILMIPLLAHLAQNLATSFRKSNTNDNFANLAGFWTAVTVATAPWALHFSVTGFESFLGQFFVTAGLFSLLKFRIRTALPIASFFGVLAVYSYFAYRYIFIGLLVVGVIFKMYRFFKFQKNVMYSKVENQKFMKDVAIGLLFASLIFAVGIRGLTSSEWYLNFLQVRLSAESVLTIEPYIHQANEYRLLAGNTFIDKILFHPQFLRARDLFSNVVSHLDPQYLFFSGDENARHGPNGFGLFQLFLAPFLLIGIHSSAKRFPHVLLFLGSWWFLSVIPAAIPSEVPHALRSLGALSPLSVIFGIGLAQSTIWIRESLQNAHKINPYYWSKKTVTAVIVILVSVLYVFEGARLIQYYTTYYRLDSGSAWQAGYTEFAQAILAVDVRERPIYVISGDDRFYLWLLLESEISASEFPNILTENYRTTSVGTIKIVQDPPTDQNFYWLGAPSAYTSEIIQQKGTSKTSVKDASQIERFNLYTIDTR